MTNRDELAQDLLECFEDFQVNAPQPGGSTAANKYVADKLADAIADGIDRGAGRSWQGKATAEQLNAIPLEDRHGGDMWLCTDGGTLNGQTPITVPPNTVVIWNGDSWSKFIHVDLSAYATKAETVAMVSIFAAQHCGVKDIVLTGNLTRLSYCKEKFAKVAHNFCFRKGQKTSTTLENHKISHSVCPKVMKIYTTFNSTNELLL